MSPFCPSPFCPPPLGSPFRYPNADDCSPVHILRTLHVVSRQAPGDTIAMTKTTLPNESGNRDELFRLLVDRVKDYAIFGLDPAGIVVSWNAGAEHIKGYKAHEIIGH